MIQQDLLHRRWRWRWRNLHQFLFLQLHFFFVSRWIVGVWGRRAEGRVRRGREMEEEEGGRGGTEALAGSLIGRRSALWPQWCRVTGQTGRGDWLAASAVERATSGVPEWKRAAPNKKTPLAAFFFLSFFFCLFVFSFLGLFSLFLFTPLPHFVFPPAATNRNGIIWSLPWNSFFFLYSCDLKFCAAWTNVRNNPGFLYFYHYLYYHC